MTDKTPKSQTEQEKKEHNYNLWKEVTKDITPLKGKNIAKNQRKPKTKATLKAKTDTSHTPTTTRTKNTYTPPEVKSTEVDHRTSQRLKRGKIPLEGRLDLHGKTQNEAYDALLDFIPHAYSQGKRCVLIITGKGSRQDSLSSSLPPKIGVLKQKTPEWLNTSPLNAYVLKTETARQIHGGEGAIYVLLRRER
ncbi:MAG: hypothetical protein COB36_07385 [Alphaproteobacteria bacterium]|nr:MAG: hypothetical protein COB36_07385 [Alphaproteobacteria bacterium]